MNNEENTLKVIDTALKLLSLEIPGEGPVVTLDDSRYFDGFKIGKDARDNATYAQGRDLIARLRGAKEDPIPMSWCSVCALGGLLLAAAAEDALSEDEAYEVKDSCILRCPEDVQNALVPMFNAVALFQVEIAFMFPFGCENRAESFAAQAWGHVSLPVQAKNQLYFDPRVPPRLRAMVLYRMLRETKGQPLDFSVPYRERLTKEEVDHLDNSIRVYNETMGVPDLG